MPGGNRVQVTCLWIKVTKDTGQRYLPKQIGERLRHGQRPCLVAVFTLCTISSDECICDYGVTDRPVRAGLPVV